MGIEKEKGVKTVIENAMYRAYEVDKKTEKKFSAHLNVDMDKGERIYYIGVWELFRVIAKIVKGKIYATWIQNEDEPLSSEFKEISTEDFWEMVNKAREMFGEPNKKKDFSKCKTADEVWKKLKEDNILGGN